MAIEITAHEAPEVEHAPVQAQQVEITQADVDLLGHKLRDWLPTLTMAEQVLMSGILQRAAANIAPSAPPHAPARLPLLEVTDGPAVGHTLLFAKPEIKIGRQKGNDLLIADRGVSARHAQIEPRPDGAFRLVDLHSTNGTEVNGQRIDQPTNLSDGDRIRVGGTELRFSVATEQSA